MGRRAVLSTDLGETVVSMFRARVCLVWLALCLPLMCVGAPLPNPLTLDDIEAVTAPDAPPFPV